MIQEWHAIITSGLVLIILPTLSVVRASELLSRHISMDLDHGLHCNN
jgi:hypothetical protein